MASSLAAAASKFVFWLTFPVFTYLVRQKVPRKTKRQLFLSSVMALFCRIDDPSPGTVKSMMRLLMCRQPVASLGVLLKSYTWQKFDEKGVLIRTDVLHASEIFGTSAQRHLDYRDKLILANEMFSYVPSWLRYGTKDLMVSDIIVLLGNLETSDWILAKPGAGVAGMAHA